jgi:TonB family protein
MSGWMGFLLEWALKSTVVLACAGLASTLLRRRSAAIRHLIWLIAVAGVLLLPAASRLTPRWSASLPIRMQAPTDIPVTVVTVHGRAGLPSVSASAVLVGLWLGGCAWVLIRRARSLARAWLAARAAAPFPAAGPAPVRISERVSLPMVCGILHPVVLLPQEAASWEPQRLQMVLWHEWMHVRRRDTLWQAFAWVACALQWFHPLLWRAVAQMRMEAEQACDDGVLEHGAKASDYAEQLVQIARRVTADDRISEGAIAMARLSQLERRLTVMLKPDQDRRQASPRLTAAVAVAAAAVLIPLAALHAPAQVPGSKLDGVVRDASGAAVPKARVTLSFAKSDRREFVITNSVGEFAFEPLPDGKYSVSVATPGFALATYDGVEVSGTNPQHLTITLAVGTLKESVDVSGGKPSAATPLGGSGTPMRIRVGGNIQSAQILTKVPPVYPPGCKAEGIEGTVLLRTVISTEGVPLSLEPVNQLVDRRLVESATEAVKQWRYKPTLLNGNPIEVLTEVQVNYTLSK